MPNAPKRQQRTLTVERLYRGKLRIERRNTSRMLYARAFLQGKYVVRSTGESTMGAATKVATDWYLEQLDRIRKGESLHGRMFAEVAEKFLKHVDDKKHAELSQGQREQYHIKWNLLKPHFDKVRITAVDAEFLLNLRNVRAKAFTQRKTLVKPATIRKDLSFVRLVLKYAQQWEKCLVALPEFPSFRGQFQVMDAPRPFLSLEQYQRLRDRAKARAEEADLNPRVRQQRQELYVFVMLCVGGALRVGEAYSLRWRDCELVRFKDADQTEAVHMRVLGKHSRGGEREDAYGLYGAVYAFKLLRAERREATPDEKLFREKHREGLKELLTLEGLRVDPTTGRTRDAKSLRPTGISLRIELGKRPIDYRDIATWCRTSVTMIEKFYDQTHPQQSAERITGFRKRTPEHPPRPSGKKTKP
jgi:hypothetical protein